MPPTTAKIKMSCHRKLSRCYVLARCTVCLMIRSVKLSTNGASAYSPVVIPSQNHVQRLRSETRLNSSAPAVNVGYDAKSIIDFYDKRPWEVGLRLNMLGLPLLGWYLGLIKDKTMKTDGTDTVERMRGEELRKHLVRSKSVALIKSGQALSLRPDLLKKKIWAEELGKLVDEVGSFPDVDAMNIMRSELSDLLPKLTNARQMETANNSKQTLGGRDTKNRLKRLVESDPVLSLFEWYNDCRVVASASIGQVYKARIRRGRLLEAAIGKTAAAIWGGKIVAIKIQR